MKGRIDFLASTDGDWLVIRLAGQEKRVPFPAGSSIISPAGRAALRIAEYELRQMQVSHGSAGGAA